MSIEKPSKLNQVLQKQFPHIAINEFKNHLVIGSGDDLYNIITGLFNNGKTIKRIHSHETITTNFNVKIDPILYNSDGAFCVFSYDKLHKFIEKVNKKIAKRTVNCGYHIPKKHRRYNYHYFLCVKDGIVFLVTNDLWDFLTEIRVQEDNYGFDDVGEYGFEVLKNRISNSNIDTNIPTLLLDLL